ncbi:adenylate kinase [bioreactor metagenome]|uniref:Adenylate kinase n=1 Tax=bioreactor metagenome TaxID=1076179 RepID=A0A644Z4P3_9ZZZZ
MVIFGPPGCGKGTQAARIVQNHGFLHVSTGDLIRNEIAEGTAMGDLYHKFISRGMLVPDQIILKELYRFALIHKNAKGMIFDGFPRTLYQAQMLDRVFAKKSMKIGLVISIDVPEAELMKRVLERGKTSGRSDDNEMVMHNRLMIYFSQTQPVIEYYRKSRRLVSIDGNQHIETVAGIIDKTIREHL